MSVTTDLAREDEIETAPLLPPTPMLLLIAGVVVVGALAALGGFLDMGAGAAPLQLGP